MQRLSPAHPYRLFDIASTRGLELRAASGLPEHTLMRRAGLAVARLGLALAPHARQVWIACGPGNNGGDGLEAAMHLQQWGKSPTVTWLGDEKRIPPDTQAALQRARQAGVHFSGAIAHDLGDNDLCIDALLGIGSTRPLDGVLAHCALQMNQGAAQVLAVDLPSGLNADTGDASPPVSTVVAQHTLSLLTLKPGLFTAQGRDCCGQVWLDDLGVSDPDGPATAVLQGTPQFRARPHASHKGSYGDVAVVGGAPGMAGAALLAAAGALYAGAGRVYATLLDPQGPSVWGQHPEIMLRTFSELALPSMTVVCGCGGGQAIRFELPALLSAAAGLVLDADALNAIALDTQLQALLLARARRGTPTVVTPHPLEAARLLGHADAAQVQGDRLSAARAIANRFQCVAVLKGSGTVVAAPGQVPVINPTGNAKLATAGTGDVLAGMLGGLMASGVDSFLVACQAVYAHGQMADEWPCDKALTAGQMPSALHLR